MVFSPFISKNSFTTCLLNKNPAPLLLTAHPSWSVGSGSDQTKSHIGPDSGISLKRSMAAMWSRRGVEGESPPWRHRVRPSQMAVSGKCVKTYMILAQTEALPYFLETSS